jgi:hypothetical protein
VPQPFAPSEIDTQCPLASGAAVKALVTAALDETPGRPGEAAWHHAGVVCANHVIEDHRDLVASELAEADSEWDATQRLGPNWLALMSGYRETLREYAERGNDA